MMPHIDWLLALHAALILLSLCLFVVAMQNVRWDEVLPRPALWGLLLMFNALMSAMIPPVDGLLGFRPHWVGACLALWLLGFSSAVMVLFMSHILHLAVGILLGHPAMLMGSGLPGFITTASRILFFELIGPLMFLSAWRYGWCRLIESYRARKNHKPAPMVDSTHLNIKITPHPTALFSRLHLPYEEHAGAVRDYFAHFFVLVFIGSGIATALAHALPAYLIGGASGAHPQGHQGGLILAGAVLLGYGEAFVTGLIYAVLRTHYPQWVYPFAATAQSRH